MVILTIVIVMTVIIIMIVTMVMLIMIVLMVDKDQGSWQSVVLAPAHLQIAVCRGTKSLASFRGAASLHSRH